MATNTSALAKPKSSAKGEPPKRTSNVEVINTSNRAGDEKAKGIQFMIPPSVIEDYGREAGEVCGFTKGAKSQMFLKLWEFYLDNKDQFKKSMM